MLKRIAYILMSIGMLCLVGCSPKQENEVSMVCSMSQPVTTYEEVQSYVTAEDFKDFFKQYFSFTEAELLMLNKNYQKMDSTYWSHLVDYQNCLLDKLGDYLCEDLKVEMKQTYGTSAIQLPRKVMIGDYVTDGHGEVIELTIEAIIPSGEDVVYEVALITCHEIEPLSDFKRHYQWSERCHYYELKEDVSLEKDLARDQIKLMQKYWVQAESGEKLQIQSIKEVTTLSSEESVRKKMTNHQHVTPLPYKDKASPKEEIAIIKLFQNIMNKPKAFYSYYRNVVPNSYEALLEMWDELGVLAYMIIEEANDAEALSEAMNPYKDNITSVALEDHHIRIETSVYSTKEQSQFIVSMPIKALLSNNEIVYYNYKYFVGMTHDKIKCIKLMNMELLTEKDVNN